MENRQRRRVKRFMNEYSRKEFISQILGYQVSWVDKERREELKENEIVKEMPAYPNKGSVKVVDNTVVIKLEETE